MGRAINNQSNDPYLQNDTSAQLIIQYWYGVYDNRKSNKTLECNESTNIPVFVIKKPLKNRPILKFSLYI